MTKKQIYLLLDSKSAPLARGVLETAPDGPILQIRVLDGKEDEVAQHEVIQLVGMESGGLAVQCQLLRQRGAVRTGKWRNAGDYDSDHGKPAGAALRDSSPADSAEQPGVLRGEVCRYVQR